jgi:DNA-directed RNA polymerase specialized sigma24 family protein
MNSVDVNILAHGIGPRVYRYFQNKGGAAHSSDLTQDTLTRLLEKYHKFDISKGPLVAFALGIAFHIWQEHLRVVQKNQKEIPLEFDNVEFSVDSLDLERIEKLDEATRLKQVVQMLPKVQ